MVADTRESGVLCFHSKVNCERVFQDFLDFLMKSSKLREQYDTYLLKDVHYTPRSSVL